ncbi:hypothetical protein AB0A63_37320 [Lentzea sp. NPDC042327]|uniref:hypothetical protein n=1 Tax=Lentzea sp. NPDC042327 TaxID=3154801 RepID=UPI003403B065
MTALTHLHRLDTPSGVLAACCAAWGACYATGPDLGVVVAVLANFTATLSGTLLDSSRTQPVAVREVGTGQVRALVVAEMVVALALATAVSWRVAAGVALALLLHLARTRLPRHGYAGPVALATATVLLPAVTAYSAAGGQADPAVWLVFSGATALATGRALRWPADDQPRDTTVRTRSAVGAALQLTAGGLLMTGAGLWFRFGWSWAVAGVVACSAFLLAARDRPDHGESAAAASTVVLAVIPLLAKIPPSA